MRLTELIEGVRLKLKDPNKLYWTDYQVVAKLNHFARSLFRKKAQAHPSYGSMQFELLRADSPDGSTQLDTSQWAYRLPSWVFRVHKVWVVGESDRLTEIPVFVQRRNNGWEFQSNRTLSIKGYTGAQDLRLQVQKVPPLMARGVLAADSPDLGAIFIPVSLPVETGETQAFPLDLEAGALVGATIEMLTATSTRDPRGSLAVVTEQIRTYNPAISAWQFELSVAPQFPDYVKLGDSFVFHSEIEDVHAELLMLLAAESLFQSYNNLAGVQVLQPSLAREWREFNDTLQPRETAAIHLVETDEEDAIFGRDPERDNNLPG